MSDSDNKLTDYHAVYFAHELTKRCASDDVGKLAYALADAQEQWLATAIQTVKLVSNTVSSVAEGSLVIRLERELTLDLKRAIADMKP